MGELIHCPIDKTHSLADIARLIVLLKPNVSSIHFLMLHGDDLLKKQKAMFVYGAKTG